MIAIAPLHGSWAYVRKDMTTLEFLQELDNVYDDDWPSVSTKNDINS